MPYYRVSVDAKVDHTRVLYVLARDEEELQRKIDKGEIEDIEVDEEGYIEYDFNSLHILDIEDEEDSLFFDAIVDDD